MITDVSRLTSAAEGPAVPTSSHSDLSLLAVAAFSLGFMNGRPFWLANGVVCAVASFLILVRRTSQWRCVWTKADAIFVLLAGLLLVAFVSAVASTSPLGIVDWFQGYLVPLFLYAACRVARLAPPDALRIVSWLAVGLVLRFLYASSIFLIEFGVPDNLLAVFFRRDLTQDSLYVDATFGNTSNTASLIAITVPVLLLSLVVGGRSFFHISSVAVALALLTANAWITGSRGVIFASVFSLVLVTIGCKVRGFLALTAVATLAMFAHWAPKMADTESLETLIEYATFALDSDQSAVERARSVQIGLETIKTFPLGVGPNRSAEFNEFSVPHQFLVNQGSDIGLLSIPIWALIFVHLVLSSVRHLKRYTRFEHYPAQMFAAGLLIWIIYALTLNIATTSGTCISWIGLFAVYAGLSRNPWLAR